MKGRGVTLVELVVAMAVVAVLALVAATGYRSYVLRSHRIEATAALLYLATAQERFYLQNNTYTDELTAAPPDGLGLQAVTENGFFDIAIGSADATGFEATATAKGRQADDSHCAAFTIDQTGSKTATSTDCWSR